MQALPDQVVHHLVTSDPERVTFVHKVILTGFVFKYKRPKKNCLS